VRLVDLDPRWSGSNYWRDGVEYSPGAGDPAFPGGRHGMGITFDCPVHGEGCRLGVPFENPIDGGPKGRGAQGKYWWQRSGETFDTLTLSPSVHVHDGDAENGPTHWHGHIENGEIR
jgi:hypothetical protein